MGYTLLINRVYWGYKHCNPLILTFDPDFLGHPSRFGDLFQETLNNKRFFFLVLGLLGL